MPRTPDTPTIMVSVMGATARGSGAAGLERPGGQMQRPRFRRGHRERRVIGEGGEEPGDDPRVELHSPHVFELLHRPLEDRKSTRLNSSHTVISYAVFCLK